MRANLTLALFCYRCGGAINVECVQGPEDEEPPTQTFAFQCPRCAKELHIQLPFEAKWVTMGDHETKAKH